MYQPKDKFKSDNLRRAQQAPNDEFYTRYSDIEKEVRHYHHFLQGKTVYCNCDNPLESQFVRYFIKHFNQLGFKRLVATHYTQNDVAYKLDINHVPHVNFDGDDALLGFIQNEVELFHSCDFQSEFAHTILKKVDVVVTNPPFSLFREMIDLLEKHNKSFLLLGSQNAVAYKDIFKLIQNGKLWLGKNFKAMTFDLPNHQTKTLGNVCWFTNIPHVKENEAWIHLTESYWNNQERYPHYDDYNAIEVSRVKDIPYDWLGKMGVPITFIHHYNPKQFKIIGLDRFVQDNPFPNKRFSINGREVYARIVIQRI